MALLPQTKGIAHSIGLRLDSQPTIGQIDAMMRSIALEIADFRPVWIRITQSILLPALTTAFATSTSPDGTPWEPLSKKYVSEKERGVGAGGKTLERSGKLMESLTRAGGGAGAQRQFGKQSARIGTTLDYALPTQWGYGSKSASSSRAAARAALGHAPTRVRASRSTGARGAVHARSFIAWSPAMRESATGEVVAFLQAIVDKDIDAINALARRA